jgi:hypothetical protein
MLYPIVEMRLSAMTLTAAYKPSRRRHNRLASGA